MATNFPDRAASLVVLSTPHHAAMVDAFSHTNQALKSSYIVFFQLPLLPEVLIRRMLAKGLRDRGLPEQHVRTYVYAMADPGAMTGALNWYRGIPFSMREPVGRIRVPTTYIWGRHDSALARRAVELTANYVVGPYEVVELEAGHWLPETVPDAVVDAVLARVESTSH